jgi:hypothetical protein
LNFQDQDSSDRPRLIRLDRNQQGDLIVLPAETTTSVFLPFIFPRFPLSLHCWLTGLGAEFRRRHDRCLAALLVLDCNDQRWIPPLIPCQTCGGDGAAWTLELGEQSLATHHRIGGSFQMRQAADLMDAAQTVPSFDGLHVVQTLKEQQTTAYCFLYSDGEAGVLPAEQAFVDDWAEALSEAAGRMSID